ncbi:hypothetical protein CHS0354_026970 [Potamilus streckersoni]|uniref:MTOR-associated protein MEAK7 n=1 Tax=Potamilus streckersoni TaxID=2493646 RepID=A0AAE0SD48_9BIVA|nr:hypothetical protein CHS0354_026970 [Potamilus streckersoni]
MGAQESKGQAVLALFSEEERTRINNIFHKLAHGHKSFSSEQFKTFLSKDIDDGFKASLFAAFLKCGGQISASHKASGVSEAHFSFLLAKVLKGSSTEKADVLCLLCSDEGKKEKTVKELSKIVKSLCNAFLKLDHSKVHNTWKSKYTTQDIDRMVQYFFTDQKTQVVFPEDTVWSEAEVEEWMTKTDMFITVFETVFRLLFPIRSEGYNSDSAKSFLPTATNVDWSKVKTILDIPSIIYLNHNLSSSLQLQWRFLYSNTLYGDSYSQLVAHILEQGPCLIVIRDKDGHIFGGFISTSCKITSKFSGSSDCFLFTLSPKYGVYTATGYNDNFFYLNQGVQTLPNGLGMGGQLNYFGLWLDQSFIKGHSKAVPKCTTFGSPQLSGKQEFEVDTVEVWGVGSGPKKNHDSDEEDKHAKKSILDKDATAKAFLELAGKSQVSEGLREPMEEEMSEEMKKKMNTIPKMF